MLSSMVSTASPDAPAELGTGHQGFPVASSNSSARRASPPSYQKFNLPVMSTQNTQEDQVLPPELPHRHESGDGQVIYVDPSHWMAILDGIKEVREHLSTFDRPLLQDGVESRDHSPELEVSYFFGASPVVDIEEILTSLLPRQTCDSLVSQYFNSKFMALGKLG
jgi:hypothetical protein